MIEVIRHIVNDNLRSQESRIDDTSNLRKSVNEEKTQNYGRLDTLL